MTVVRQASFRQDFTFSGICQGLKTGLKQQSHYASPLTRNETTAWASHPAQRDALGLHTDLPARTRASSHRRRPLPVVKPHCVDLQLRLRPLPGAFRCFIEPILKGSDGSRPYKNSAKFCKRLSRARFFSIFSTLNALRPRRSERNGLV
jgi:hypothetical protein